MGDVISVESYRDGCLKLKGATSGETTLKAPAVASSYVQTLPARSGTVADDTDLALKAPLASPNFTGNVGMIPIANGGAPILGTPKNGFIVKANDGLYGLQISIHDSGDAYLQVQRIDGTATAYNLHIQSAGGSTLFGDINAKKDGAGVILTNATGGATPTAQYIPFRDSAGTEKAYLGYGSASSLFRVINEMTGGNMVIDTQGDLGFNTASSQRILVKSTGNVEVAKNTKTASLQINGNEVGAGYGKAIEAYVASNVGYINCFDRDSAVAEFDLVIDALSHTFKTGTTGAGTTRMTISSTGVVTITNRIESTRITKRAPVITQSANITINTDITDVAHITGLAQNTTITTSGTPVEGDELRIDITDNGSDWTYTWNSIFESSGNGALPTSSGGLGRQDLFFTWNTVTSKWRLQYVSHY